MRARTNSGPGLSLRNWRSAKPSSSLWSATTVGKSCSNVASSFTLRGSTRSELGLPLTFVAAAAACAPTLRSGPPSLAAGFCSVSCEEGCDGGKSGGDTLALAAISFGRSRKDPSTQGKPRKVAHARPSINHGMCTWYREIKENAHLWVR